MTWSLLGLLSVLSCILAIEVRSWRRWRDPRREAHASSERVAASSVRISARRRLKRRRWGTAVIGTHDERA